MRWESLFLCFVLLAGWCLKTVQGASDEHDAGNQENTGTNLNKITKRELNTRKLRDVAGTGLETNWNVPYMNKGNYEDADWHPSTSIQETRSHLTPDAPVMGSDNDVDKLSQNWNQTNNNSSTRCGEFSSQLTPSGHCRLTATLPPAETGQKPCPDMFRCTDDISFWLHENQNRKEQLKELRETMSELQEELRNHRHRVKVLEMQVHNKRFQRTKSHMFEIFDVVFKVGLSMYPRITFIWSYC